ncbi:unnamed protein product [Orchesella dallaii]|uniref:Ig-like domain-containing protein n=1 Tax=Orchesella dallaii TaxID=48710 RepID=A0ABP1PLI3_9HEXA
MGFHGSSYIFFNLVVILMEILVYGAETSDVLPGINTYHSDHDKGRPYFDVVGRRNVTAVVGQTARLNCRVKNLGDQQVSWIRKRDLHVLTSTVFTFSSDARFSVIHPENSDDWTLEIKFVQKRDAGVYECQVNTEPKMNLAMLLNVEDREMLSEQGIHSTRPTKEAQAKIAGPEEVYVKTGSMISLICSVNIHSQPAGSVTWYHGSNIVDFNSPRGGISLETEKTDAGTTSKLVITRANTSDSGNYTCVPSNAYQASVWVHVLNGEHSAPMQHGEHGYAPTFSSSIVLTVVILFIHCVMTR